MNLKHLFLMIIAIVLFPASDIIAEPNNLENSQSSVVPEENSKDKVKSRELELVTEPEDPFAARLRERKTPLPPPPKLDPARANDPDYVAEMWWEHLGYTSKKQASEFLKVLKRNAEEAGMKWTPPQPGDPYYVEDTFEMPQNELLDGCTYAPGYSYPGSCFDERGNIVFNSSIHSQDVLDKVIKKQGKTGGKYNKLPKVKRKPSFSETFYIDD